MREIISFVSVLNIAFFCKEECEEFDEKVNNFLENVSYYDEHFNKIEIKPFKLIHQSADPMHEFHEKIRNAEYFANYIVIKENLNFDYFKDFRTNLWIYDKPGTYIQDLAQRVVTNVEAELEKISKEYKRLVDIGSKIRSNA